jgi:low affinity Fe/Cu permease
MPAGELTLTSQKTVPKQTSKDPVEEIKSRLASETKGDAFGRFAAAASTWLGSKWAFIGAISIIIAWAVTGPIFHYSDTWQLIINTGTTIVTFLMVFLIQNTQNRDARAINLKLNELIRSIDAAGDNMMDIEKLSDEELDTMQKRYERIREQWTKRHKSAAPDK